MQPQQPPPPLQDSRNPPPPSHLSNGAPRPPNRMANDPRGRAPLPVPSGPGAHLQNGQPRSVPSFDMARSPPNPPPSKSEDTPFFYTKHVPCKFFRQGACQAGPACPFLHSTDSAVDSAPCKYFTKGNCKFGAKCALAHILPDGRRVNRPNIGMGMGGGGNLNLGGRVNYPPYHPQDSALANSLLSQQQMNGHGPRLYPYQEDLQMHGRPQLPMQPQPPYDNIPIIDTGLETGSRYGSPPEDGRHAISPIGRSALDAPLPASFDSQGISYIARHGPVASSVPSRFGFDLSPTPSSRADMFRNLHDTTFGSDFKKFSTLSSSPVLSGDEGTTARVMHSQRVSRPKMLSASLPRPTVLDDWDDNFAMEEDYLPADLHDDVLTPQEKMRRLSRTEHDSHSGRDLSGLGLPLTGSAKVGSPLASSPSRFGALFAKQRQKKEEENQSALGNVGSPLRDSSLSMRSSPGLRPIGSRPSSGDISPFIASPPRQPSMSMITQQLSSTSLHPNSARHTSAGSRLDRTISSPMSTSRIDEEQSDLVFSMEEEENRRNSSAWNVNKLGTNDASTTSRDGDSASTATTPKDIVYKKRA
ncbi:conserved hypothetical protein [Uncinocarpus reesii 1704]|uniref:C3H1-type domain-containing protein n=1 Tax=Uncinocarpus reesii (strain UAMH 1704) TaxID=336963 RepID=C4JWM8_UNCRE|nr:uncharacterized protein UREG_06970 [Uncinocarpus reesii 1704]EEP82105.1 conserved hypothetical protein [Uncinocarpus reesii 1704]